MTADIVISIALALVIAFLIAQVARTIRTSALHKTLRKSIEAGQPVGPELIEQLDRAPEPGANDQRIGFVLVALALALIGAGLLNPGDDNWLQLMTIALFPLFVGAALLLRLRLARRSQGE